MKRSFIKSIASFFAFFCIIFIPFPFNITTIQLHITDFLFGKLIGFISSSIFGKTLHSTKVYSDSVSMYILVALLFVLAVIISLLVIKLKKWTLYRQKLFYFFYCLAMYYLALQLLKYGADKIFKNQFYIPEPNILYTSLGKVDKDLLYWSAMGTSHFYSVFLGVLEAIAAVLILIRRTRLLGLLLSVGILLNIVAVNMGFDISVKLFSFFLLYLAVYLVLPYWNRLYQLFWVKESGFSNTKNPEVVLWKNRFLSYFLKWFVTGLIFLEVLYPFIRSGIVNGDRAQRPYLHGAYEVQQMISGTDTLAADQSPIKRFFIHKDSYMIFQSRDDEMQDYKLSYDNAKSLFILTDYKLKQIVLSFYYQSADSILVMHYATGGKQTRLTGKLTDWKKMPALKKEFHWTVD